MTGSAVEVIAARIHREGSIAFDTFMELALYEPEVGFFAQGYGAGRSGRDFVTSPEIGSTFGACVARALDRTWESFGRPDPFLVAEAAAGSGRLAREILRAAPACLAALRYVLIEKSASLRARQRELLQVEPADEALGPFTRQAREDELLPVAASGPVFASLTELPDLPVDSMVFANELLDNLPVGIAQWDGARWQELRVTMEGGTFAEIAVPATEMDAAAFAPVVAGKQLRPGTRLPIPRGIERWLDDCARALPSGIVTLVDYFVDVDELLDRDNAWLRTYRAHGTGTEPLRDPGTQDITADVLREQVARAAHSVGFAIVEERTQADWLRDLGIDALAEEARATWDAGAARGDLEALAARSRVGEVAALTDPTGLGAHRVVVLGRNV
ncbi:MAG: SAM-dependent methyltransferase [Acidimicrobiia bacterium]